MTAGDVVLDLSSGAMTARVNYSQLGRVLVARLAQGLPVDPQAVSPDRLRQIRAGLFTGRRVEKLRLLV